MKATKHPAVPGTTNHRRKRSRTSGANWQEIRGIAPTANHTADSLAMRVQTGSISEGVMGNWARGISWHDGLPPR
jgi:hypothetical protein